MLSEVLSSAKASKKPHMRHKNFLFFVIGELKVQEAYQFACTNLHICEKKFVLPNSYNSKKGTANVKKHKPTERHIAQKNRLVKPYQQLCVKVTCVSSYLHSLRSKAINWMTYWVSIFTKHLIFKHESPHTKYFAAENKLVTVLKNVHDNMTIYCTMCPVENI